MADFPSMPLFTDAYLADTTHLSTEEHGAYLLLLMSMWRTAECRLKDDDRTLARICRCTEKRWRERLRPALEGFFTSEDGHWTQKKLSKVRAHVETVCEKRREAANARHKAKPLAPNETAPANADADGMLTKTKSKTKEANHEELLSEPAEPALPDVKAAVWKALVGVLGPSSRPLIGSWFRDYGEDGVILAYSAYRSAALGGEKLDPKSYIAGIMKNAAKKKSNGMGIADKIRAQLAAEGITLQ